MPAQTAADKGRGKSIEDKTGKGNRTGIWDNDQAFLKRVASAKSPDVSLIIQWFCSGYEWERKL